LKRWLRIPFKHDRTAWILIGMNLPTNADESSDRIDVAILLHHDFDSTNRDSAIDQSIKSWKRS
jgi:hypothetical protein